MPKMPRRLPNVPKDRIPPGMMIDVADFLSSQAVAAMNAAEVGGYFMLLLHAWGSPDCALPDDPEHLASISKLGAAWNRGSGEKILRNFLKKNGRIFNLKELEVRKTAIQAIENKKKAGIASGNSRRNKGVAKRTAFEQRSSDVATEDERTPPQYQYKYQYKTNNEEYQ